MTRIAEIQLDARHKDGNRRSVCIAISKPELDPKDANGHTYRTLLEFEGFHKPHYIYGNGSLRYIEAV